MNRKGFVSSALIYTFFVLFLLLMVFLLNRYSSTRYMVDRYRYDIKEELFEMFNKDVNLFIMVKKNGSSTFSYVKELEAGKSYSFQSSQSYCKDSINAPKDGQNSLNSSVKYENGEIVIESKGIAFCYAYFVEN